MPQTWVMIAFVVAVLSGIGIGLFLGMMLRRPKVFYEGKVVLHGNVLTSDHLNKDPKEAGNAYPTSVLNIGFKHRYDGRATLQFEGDCPARELLGDSEVGDIWKLSLSRTKKVKASKKNIIDWRDTEMGAAFGKGRDRGPLG